MKPPIKYCAVYTRKSTEEGLEQDFNSLDAQREACLAYITSQKAEGWVPVPDEYDDGGYSGGNLERPALKRLMEDIKSGKVNIIVVYKIDRLTRSLMDFSKLVEVFDQYGVTFVSITQSFNTTTSMGRLTLNVLLSFAQFEREVIGERVRDKIAASKKKGMWMGGTPPLGYDIENRQLSPNKSEIERVIYIFERYLKLKNVNLLKQELDRDNVNSREFISKSGNVSGGKSYSRGALYALLSNPIYIGKVRHKDKIYDGQHKAIISETLWSDVQDLLKSNASNHRVKKQSRNVNLLKGLLFDEHGVPYSPGYTSKGKKQYRYYISQNIIQQKPYSDNLPKRFPAHEIENLIEKNIREYLNDRNKVEEYIDEVNLENITIDKIVIKSINKIIVYSDQLIVHINLRDLCAIASINAEDLNQTITIPYKAWKHKKGAIILSPKEAQKDIFDLPPDKLKKLVQGIIWRDEHFAGMSLTEIAKREGYSDAYVGKAILFGFDTLLQA
jgi:site-specific DNA recombinase